MKLKIIAAMIIFILVASWGTIQYTQKQHYVRHLSGETANSIAYISYAISDNDNLYQEIIQAKSVSLEQIEQLANNNNIFAKNMASSQTLAINTKKAKGEELNDIAVTTAYKANSYLYGLMMDIAEIGGKDTNYLNKEDDLKRQFPLDEEWIEKLQVFQSLNQVWIKAMVDNVKEVDQSNGRIINEPLEFFNVYGQKGVEKKYWVNFLLDANSNTQKFSQQQDVNKLLI